MHNIYILYSYNIVIPLYIYARMHSADMIYIVLKYIYIYRYIKLKLLLIYIIYPINYI